VEGKKRKTRKGIQPKGAIAARVREEKRRAFFKRTDS